MPMSETKGALFACLAIAAIFSGVNGKPPSRISGGQYVAPGELKYMVALMKGDSHICGGAIISPRHVLTAGHCVEDPRGLSIISGIVDLNDPNRIVHKVSRVFLHPDYVPYTTTTNVERDIAVIVLEKDIKFGDRLSMVQLPCEQPHLGSSAVVAGWGFTTPDNMPTALLKKLYVTFLNEKSCMEKRGWFTDDRLCGYRGTGTICGGDSGSPLVAGGYVVGISSASTCVLGDAHVYTNVYYYLPWITEIMRAT